VKKRKEMFSIKCVVCGTQKLTKRSDTVYCSKRCKWVAWDKRHPRT
jgi:endogenous inhibitor of DNA gyrase (YacG/DUF329 family)